MNRIISGKFFLILITDHQDGSLPLELNDYTVHTVDLHRHLGHSVVKKFDFNIYIDNKKNRFNNKSKKLSKNNGHDEKIVS